MKNNIKLTLKTAKQLVKQEFGIKNPNLNIECAKCNIFVYTMKLGHFNVIISNDYFDVNGLIKLSISTCSSPYLNIFYDPYTLVETDI